MEEVRLWDNGKKFEAGGEGLLRPPRSNERENNLPRRPRLAYTEIIVPHFQQRRVKVELDW